jgi:hypothetical protein
MPNIYAEQPAARIVKYVAQCLRETLQRKAMGEDGVDISAKTPVYGICSRRIDLLCKSARADCGSGAIILVQEREYVIVKRLEIEVLDLL